MIHFMYMNMRFDLHPKNNLVEGISGSKAENIIGKFQKWIEDNNYNVETLNSEEAVRELVSKKYGAAMRALQTSVDEVIIELKKLGFLVEVIPEKVKAPKVYEEVSLKKTNDTEFKLVDDPEVLKKLEENKFFHELEKNIFKNDAELNSIYERSLSLGKENSLETPEYYYEFADAGLIKGGRAEVEKDLAALSKITDIFDQNKESLDEKKANSHEKTKKIATIAERAIAYGVSELGWCGDGVSIDATSNFDDVKRGVDEVMQIKSEGMETSSLGLGIDVTYRGLLSESYKGKFMKLLNSINNGYSTQIKYFKNHAGEMMEEFSVPKIVLYVNFEEVKDLIRMINNSDNSEVMNEFKKSPQRFSVINQVIVMCEELGAFAKDCGNDVSDQYYAVVNSMRGIIENNSEIKEVLNKKENDEISTHIKYLIQEFKNN